MPALKKTKLNVISNSKNMTGYRFIKKDPIIDEIASIMERSGLNDTQISNASGVTPATLRRWRYGNTKRPQHMTVKFVLRACGYDYRITKIS